MRQLHIDYVVIESLCKRYSLLEKQAVSDNEHGCTMATFYYHNEFIRAMSRAEDPPMKLPHTMNKIPLATEASMQLQAIAFPVLSISSLASANFLMTGIPSTNPRHSPTHIPTKVHQNR
jgi:hypothetical protein